MSYENVSVNPSRAKSVMIEAMAEPSVSPRHIAELLRPHWKALTLALVAVLGETVTDLLAKQYEVAKVDEAKESALIQVLDKAIEPDRRSRPKRSQMVILATLVAFVIGVLLAIVREAVSRVRDDPRQSERLRTFRRYLRWR